MCRLYTYVNVRVTQLPRLWQQKHLEGQTLHVLIYHHGKKSKGEGFSESISSAYYLS